MFAPDALTQRKRIVHVTYEAVYDGVDNTYDHATHYDYDIHGNVKTLLQDNRSIAGVSNISQHRFKRTDYIYDLISGNVHRVDYQTGSTDQWHHTYEYDADNRITEVYTSTETPITSAFSTIASLQNEPVINPLWDQEAEYSYYAHGPLARTVLGEEKVQGLDYVYTLQGWIKSVNSNTLDPNRDPGKDGLGLSANSFVARDVYGYSLHYFEGDYGGAIGGNNTFVATQPATSGMKQNSSDLYNGNIARMVTTITDPNTRAVLPLGNAYKYDQLNRLKEARSFNNIDLSGNIWHSGGTEMYYNAFTYDANGNIQTQYRADENNLSIDELTYNYETGYNSAPRNRLSYVSDVSNNTFANELINQQSGNYQYDKEGRLIHDEKEEIRKIIWRVDGKVKKIERLPNSTKKNVSFDYDAMGHRIAKHVYTSANVWEKSTFYVLDAQGNTMSTYEHVNDNVNQIITYAQTEKHIYGSSRLGVNNERIPLFGSQNATYSMKVVTHKIGERTYELSNHLGNVLSIISDKVIPHDNNGTVDYYMADIRHSQDYSPFGVTLHGRDLSLSTTGNKPYRYGFQNQEEDPETGLVNFEYRMHNPRLGRFFAIDPLAYEFPWNSPYAFSENRVVDGNELEGCEFEKSTDPNSVKVTITVYFEGDGLGGNCEANLGTPEKIAEFRANLTSTMLNSAKKLVEGSGELKFDMENSIVVFKEGEPPSPENLTENEFSVYIHAGQFVPEDTKETSEFMGWCYNSINKGGKLGGRIDIDLFSLLSGETYKNTADGFDYFEPSFGPYGENLLILHEMGHFLGLPHPDEMEEGQKYLDLYNGKISAKTTSEKIALKFAKDVKDRFDCTNFMCTPKFKKRLRDAGMDTNKYTFSDGTNVTYYLEQFQLIQSNLGLWLK